MSIWDYIKNDYRAMNFVEKVLVLGGGFAGVTACILMVVTS